MKIKMGLIFFSFYLAFLVVTAPATLLTRFIPKTSGIKLVNLSGSLWDGKASKLEYRDQFQIQMLSWQFDWTALLTLKVKADLVFSNSKNMLTGKGSISYGLSGVTVSDTTIDANATALNPYLQLPIEVIPAGKFTLNIVNATRGIPYCGDLDAYVVWHGARVDTDFGNIDFATPSMDVSCEEGNLVGDLKQQSEQLTSKLQLKLKEGGKYQLTGSILGRETLPPAILDALSWLGPKTSTGERAINFEGKI